MDAKAFAEQAARVQKERENYAAAEAARQAERDAEREAASEIIKLGFKQAAKKHHPDAGGSHTAMTRLNRAKDRLKANR